jgi:hypothetical protein
MAGINELPTGGGFMPMMASGGGGRQGGGANFAMSLGNPELWMAKQQHKMQMERMREEYALAQQNEMERMTKAAQIADQQWEKQVARIDKLTNDRRDRLTRVAMAQNENRNAVAIANLKTSMREAEREADGKLQEEQYMKQDSRMSRELDEYNAGANQVKEALTSRAERRFADLGLSALQIEESFTLSEPQMTGDPEWSYLKGSNPPPVLLESKRTDAVGTNAPPLVQALKNLKESGQWSQDRGSWEEGTRTLMVDHLVDMLGGDTLGQDREHVKGLVEAILDPNGRPAEAASRLTPQTIEALRPVAAVLGDRYEGISLAAKQPDMMDQLMAMMGDTQKSGEGGPDLTKKIKAMQNLAGYGSQLPEGYRREGATVFGVLASVAGQVEAVTAALPTKGDIWRGQQQKYRDFLELKKLYIDDPHASAKARASQILGTTAEIVAAQANGVGISNEAIDFVHNLAPEAAGKVLQRVAALAATQQGTQILEAKNKGEVPDPEYVQYVQGEFERFAKGFRENQDTMRGNPDDMFTSEDAVKAANYFAGVYQNINNDLLTAVANNDTAGLEVAEQRFQEVTGMIFDDANGLNILKTVYDESGQATGFAVDQEFSDEQVDSDPELQNLRTVLYAMRGRGRPGIVRGAAAGSG